MGEETANRCRPWTLQRLRAVRALRDAGVNAGVLMAPLVPGFTTQPARLERTIKAIADHGAAFMGANLLQRRYDVAGRAVPVPPRPETATAKEDAAQTEFRWTTPSAGPAASGRNGRASPGASRSRARR